MRWLRSLADVLVPPVCRVCRRQGDFPLCDTCAATFRLITPPRCATCGRPLSMPMPATCAACLRRTPLFACARPAGVYEGSLRDAIHALKFDGCRALAAPLGDLITRAVRAEGSLQADVVVPVPLHPSRLRARGFNQAELLAHRVARTLHLPCHTRLVRRRRLTAPQSTLERTGREANVLGAFSCAGGLAGVTVLLVDDVMSTGNTASACAGALLEAGAASVVVATVAAALLGQPGSGTRTGSDGGPERADGGHERIGSRYERAGGRA